MRQSQENRGRAGHTETELGKGTLASEGLLETPTRWGSTGDPGWNLSRRVSGRERRGHLGSHYLQTSAVHVADFRIP